VTVTGYDALSVAYQLPRAQVRRGAGTPDRPPRPPFAWRGSRLADVATQVGLVAGMTLLYEGLRFVTEGDLDTAERHARTLWGWERWLHLPSEATLQRPFLDNHAVVRFLNGYYANLHFTVTFIVFAWLLVRHRAWYGRLRDVLLLTTALGLIVEAFYPLAPPRLNPIAHVVDTARVYGPSVYNPNPTSGGVANQFAAMPSLHVAWAVLVAVAVVGALKTRWRWLAVLYPIATIIVVLVTANHYWLDGIVGCVLLVVAAAVTRPLASRRVIVLPDTEPGAVAA
jgi:hypothetical protein